MTRDHGSDPAIDLDADGVYSISPEVVTATFDGRVVLYHLDKGRALTLNQTAGIILELVASGCQGTEIRGLLREAYPESADDVGRDVVRTLRYLLEHGALEASSPTVS